MESSLETRMERSLETRMESSLETRMESSLETRMESSLETRMERSLETRLESSLETRMERSLETRMESSLETRMEKSLETRMERSLETRMESSLETRIESSLETRIESNLETRMETRMESSLETRLESSLETRLESSLETRMEKSLETRMESSLETRLESSLETRIESSLETRIESSLETRMETPALSTIYPWLTQGQLGAQRQQQIEGAGSETSTLPQTHHITEGWALRQFKRGQRMSDKTKSYLTDIFNEGATSGQKADAAQVAQQMQHARGTDGKPLFQPSENSYNWPLESRRDPSNPTKLLPKLSLPVIVVAKGKRSQMEKTAAEFSASLDSTEKQNPAHEDEPMGQGQRKKTLSRCFALIRTIAKQFKESNIAGQKKRQVTQALFQPLKGKPMEEQEALLERLAVGATVKEFKEALGRVRSKSAVDRVMKKMSAALTKSFKKDTPKKRQRKPTKKALEAMEDHYGSSEPAPTEPEAQSPKSGFPRGWTAVRIDLTLSNTSWLDRSKTPSSGQAFLYSCAADRHSSTAVPRTGIPLQLCRGQLGWVKEAYGTPPNSNMNISLGRLNPTERHSSTAVPRTGIPLQLCRGQAFHYICAADRHSSTAMPRTGIPLQLCRGQAFLYSYAADRHSSTAMPRTGIPLQLCRGQAFLYSSAGDDKSSGGFKPLCPTRWTARTAALQSILGNYSTIMDTMQEVNETTRDEYGLKAGGQIILKTLGYTYKRCKVHGVSVKLKGHKKDCPWQHCKCPGCSLVVAYRKEHARDQFQLRQSESSDVEPTTLSAAEVIQIANVSRGTTATGPTSISGKLRQKQVARGVPDINIQLNCGYQKADHTGPPQSPG
ncbi:hypothetical protein Bbelb_051530 [Branchiostoma belcheri]|nr:hypothetical protein Bbelb_051530 [Branchiostoma belcheri]